MKIIMNCTSTIEINEFNDLLHEIEEVLYEKLNINYVNIQPELDWLETKAEQSTDLNSNGK